MEENIESYLEALLEKAGLTHLPEDFRARYLLKLRGLLEERIGGLALQYLPKEKQKDLDAILASDTPDPNKMQELLMSEIPDYEQKLQKLLVEFAQQFLADTSTVTKV